MKQNIKVAKLLSIPEELPQDTQMQLRTYTEETILDALQQEFHV